MIYIVAHKQFELPTKEDANYKVIYVGTKMRDWAHNNSQLSDSDGEHNIADKNTNYCELTALYWVYKNDNISKNIGLNHYRRYFKSSKGSSIASSKELDEYLEDYDVVLPKKLHFLIPVEQNYYMTTGYVKDIDLLKKTILKLYPDYLHTLNSFLKGKDLHYANMFYMSREHMKAYSEWLFSILFEMEKSVDMEGYTSQERRLYGYLGELLLNVWVIKNQLKIKELNLFNTEDRVLSPIVRFKNHLIQQSKYIAKYILYFPSGIPTRRRK